MQTHPPAERRVGLLAAWGRYPLLLAEALRNDGYSVYCVGVKGHADPALREVSTRFTWMGPARLGVAMRFFRRHSVQRATMAGKFHKVNIYQPWAFVRYFPDATFLRTFAPHFLTGKADRKDDTLLGALTDSFDQRGVQFVAGTDFAPELLVKPGHIAGRAPTSAQLADIEFGWRMAREMGRLDIGQSVCVKDRAVIAVEAIEGTDECIERAGSLCRQGGFTVVKVAKPQQDMRFDVPTVGVRTLRTMAEAGGKVLAIEAGKTILLDDREFRASAKSLGVTVVALEAPAASATVAA